MKKTILIAIATVLGLLALTSCNLLSSESGNRETVITKPTLKKETLPRKIDSIETTKVLDTTTVDSLISE